jgi:hypothetical protein
VRLRTLSPVVTAFILGYSNSTFSGRHLHPLSYAPFDAEISRFSAQLFPLHFDMASVDTNI